ncbi:MAG: murein biosynthesis integral membrane protein MurJ [Victivallales bacterium]|nr:murein biosynthesis integral membrane protein MurJ [Victivallales bacterium]
MAIAAKSILKSSGGLMIATLLSRILGFLRVMYEAFVLGGGALAGAWQMAFLVPNWFRRLFGEGALSAAMIPMISHELVTSGLEQARQSITLIVASVGILLSLLCIVISGGSLLAVHLVSRTDLVLIFRIIPLVAPYMIFICLIGVMSSALNSIRVFFWPAMGAVLLNLCEIAALVWLCPKFTGKNYETLEVLSYTVLAAGIVQFILTLGMMYYYGLGLVFSRESFHRLAVLKELWLLMLPGLIGAAGVQISTLVDRTMAISLGEYALPALNNCDRLVFLPISVFALSLGGVVLPRMSKAAARNNLTNMLDIMFFGLHNLLFMCLPATVFLMVFRVEILRLIFMHGNFNTIALREAAWTIMFYAIGIPCFAGIKIVVAGFQARKDMKTPMKVSLCCIVVNIILNLILMWPLRQGGIALATVLSSLMNNTILLLLLRRDLGMELPLKSLLRPAVQATVISLLLAIALFYLYPWLSDWSCLPHWLGHDLWPLMVCGTVFAGLYFLILHWLDNREAKALWELLLRRNS